MTPLLVSISVLLAALSAGQPSRQPAEQRIGQTGGSAPAWSRFQQVEPGSVDRDPLAVAQRTINFTDLREPYGFADLYRLPGANGNDVFARRSGATTALFPRGVYGTDRRGRTTIDVPPGTVFVLGDPSPQTLAQFGVQTEAPAQEPRSFNAISFSAAAPARPGPVEPRASAQRRLAPQTPTAGVFISEDYRQRRVTDLIGLAARAASRGR